MSSRVIISLKHRPEGLQLNGEHIRTIDRIHAGDTLSVTMEDTPPDYLESEIRVPVLYEDEDVMVYNKPVDMPCHQAKTHQQDTLANVFARDCRERGLTLSYRCINRLDRNTSGAVVVEQRPDAATVLGGGGRHRHKAGWRRHGPSSTTIIDDRTAASTSRTISDRRNAAHTHLGFEAAARTPGRRRGALSHPRPPSDGRHARPHPWLG